MDGEAVEVELLAVAEDMVVAARIVRLTRDLAQTRIDACWWALPEISKKQKQLEIDYSWRWAGAIGELRNDRWHEFIAVQTDDGEIQRAMLYRFDTRSFVSPDVGAVHVQNLATAPHNRPWLVPQPLYRGAGESLLLQAVCHSYLMGLEGRVNLLAIDDARTLKFYQSRGFEIVEDDDGLPMLELTADIAWAWLREEGYDL